MSTSIYAYPANNFMPFVEQTRARTQELFQAALDRNNIKSTIEVRAFYISCSEDSNEEIRYVEKDLVWSTELPGLGFAYWLNGKWDSSSCPICMKKQTITEFDIQPEDEEVDTDIYYPVDMLGQIEPLLDDEIGNKRTVAEIKALNSIPHYWADDRNFAGPAISSIGYGFSMAAIAEATNGILSSLDCAFDEQHNGENATEFLSWWGDSQIDFYSYRFC